MASKQLYTKLIGKSEMCWEVVPKHENFAQLSNSQADRDKANRGSDANGIQIPIHGIQVVRNLRKWFFNQS